MEKSKLIELIEMGLTYQGIANATEKSNSTVSYWLKKYNLKTNRKKYEKTSYNQDGLKKCSMCCEYYNDDQFYKRTSKTRKGQITSYCKSCNTIYRRENMIENKLKMVEYKGGECIRCGLKLMDSHYSVFEFHHLDPNEKDPNWNKMKFLGKKSWDKIKEGLDKCVLLCANCHRITHAEITSERRGIRTPVN